MTFILLVSSVFAQSPAALEAVPFTDVQLDSGFWSYWVDLTRDQILPHCLRYCGSEGKLSNFMVASGRMPGKHRGAVWEDSDVYKVIEGAAYCLSLKRDPAIEKTFDDIIDTIAACQQPDGYLDTYFTLVEPDNRWSDDTKHETYCAGHLIEAAVAYYEATQKRALLDVAVKLANHMYDVFGPGKQTDVSEHEEIELALVKLWRVTKDDRYLELAKLFIDRRGHQDGRKPVPEGSKGGWGEVCQDHKPVRDQREIVGHAVRAMYLYSGVTDVLRIAGDEGFKTTLDAIWDDVVSRKMYVTGGIGDASLSNEGFSKGYYLPNDSAYCETCASIGMALWNQRMALLYGDAKYADIVEREMYNGILGSTSMDGHRFYYCNKLQGNDHRPPWQGCACCPTNIVRFLPSIAGYVYATSPDTVYVNHFVACRAKMKVAGLNVEIAQATQYPWQGQVELQIKPEQETRFALRIRVPAWCRNGSQESDLYTVRGQLPQNAYTVSVNGIETAVQTDKGYAVVDRQWKEGDVVRLELQMPALRVYAHEKVAADTGRVALQRGPLVYCFENIDNQQAVAHTALTPAQGVKSRYEPKLLGGIVTLEMQGSIVKEGESKPVSAPLIAIPFYARDNRQQTYMQVWMPEDAANLRPMPKPTIASTSRAETSWANNDSVLALNDRIAPSASKDMTVPRMTWWDRKGTQEWASYTFGEIRTVGSAAVYWFDDTGIGQCRVPQSWRILYLDGVEWRPVEDPSEYGVKTDAYNRVTFKPVKTTAIRLEVQLQPEFSGGILEWQLEAN